MLGQIKKRKILCVEASKNPKTKGLKDENTQ